MKPLTAQPHGVLDYLVGLLLLISPWLLQFDDVSSTARITMVTLGIIVLGLSLVTDYPLGVIKIVPFRVHGIIETIGALFLLVSPWLLGFSEVTTATYFAVVVAIAYLGVIALTNYTYSSRHQLHH
jgi:hypothetical protein